MLDIAYVHMINLYSAAKAPTDPAIPESIKPLNKDDMDGIYEELFE